MRSRQTFVLLANGSCRISGPCPTCKNRRTFYVGGPERYVETRILQGGYECDACLDNATDEVAAEVANA